MLADAPLLLTFAFFLIAFLYASVGHAGASGYIAAMALFSLAPAEMKPTALVLNVVVASIASWQFWRAGCFSWQLFWPFALLATPCAFVGGYLNLPTQVFQLLVGTVLLFSAIWFLMPGLPDKNPRPPATPLAIFVGGGLGLLAGLTGTGGGIFLTPLLLLMGWATTRTAAAVSAFFILLNSSFGLLGNWHSTENLPAYIPPLVLAVMVGGTLGSYLGSRHLPVALIKKMLALVLLIASAKFLFL